MQRLLPEFHTGLSPSPRPSFLSITLVVVEKTRKVKHHLLRPMSTLAIYHNTDQHISFTGYTDLQFPDYF